MQNRWSEENVISFNVKYITAFWVRSTPHPDFWKKQSKEKQRNNHIFGSMVNFSLIGEQVSKKRAERGREAVSSTVSYASFSTFHHELFDMFHFAELWRESLLFRGDHFSIIYEEFGANFSDVASITTRPFQPDRETSGRICPTLCQLAPVTVAKAGDCSGYMQTCRSAKHKHIALHAKGRRSENKSLTLK